jgi:hypothetical protein
MADRFEEDYFQAQNIFVLGSPPLLARSGTYLIGAQLVESNDSRGMRVRLY